jgi:hypothetical protein
MFIACPGQVLYGPVQDILENDMKHSPMLLAGLLLALCCLGCKQNVLDLNALNMGGGTEYVGEYMRADDVRRIAHALDTVPARTPVKWENMDTGYQYSMMVFASDTAAGVTSRTVSVLAIEPSGDAEVFDLFCTSDTPRKWRMEVRKPAVFVGRAARMELPPSATPAGTLASADSFKGFVISR